eukprot:11172934-Lingulodinium_polyedra.AAC.1
MAMVGEPAPLSFPARPSASATLTPIPRPDWPRAGSIGLWAHSTSPPGPGPPLARLSRKGRPAALH